MIRKAVPEDADGIGELLAQVATLHANLYPDCFKGGVKYFKSELLSLFNRPDFVLFVSETEGRIVAESICSVRFIVDSNCLVSRKILYIDDFCVDALFRGHGTGNELLSYIQEYALNSGFDYIELNCWEKNKKAHNFYSDFGFNDQKITMSLKLTKK